MDKMSPSDEMRQLPSIGHVQSVVRKCLTMLDGDLASWAKIEIFLEAWDEAENHRRNNVQYARQPFLSDPALLAQFPLADQDGLAACVKGDEGALQVYYAVGLFMRKRHISHVLAHDPDSPSDPAQARALHDVYFDRKNAFFDDIPALYEENCDYESAETLGQIRAVRKRVKLLANASNADKRAKALQALQTFSRSFRSETSLVPTIKGVIEHVDGIASDSELICRILAHIASIETRNSDKHADHRPEPAANELEPIPPKAAISSPRKRKRSSPRKSPATSISLQPVDATLPLFIKPEERDLLHGAGIGTLTIEDVAKRLDWSVDVVQLYCQVERAIQSAVAAELSAKYCPEDLVALEEVYRETKPTQQGSIVNFQAAVPHWQQPDVERWQEEKRILSAINSHELKLPLLVSPAMRQTLEAKYLALKGQKLDRKLQKEIYACFGPEERRGWKPADVLRWFRERFDSDHKVESKRTRGANNSAARTEGPANTVPIFKDPAFAACVIGPDRQAPAPDQHLASEVTENKSAASFQSKGVSAHASDNSAREAVTFGEAHLHVSLLTQEQPSPSSALGTDRGACPDGYDILRSAAMPISPRLKTTVQTLGFPPIPEAQQPRSLSQHSIDLRSSALLDACNAPVRQILTEHSEHQTLGMWED